MTTEIATTGSTALTIADDQTSFTDQQAAVLQHLGVDGASRADLDVFFHVVKRTGLDPFARQIYMLSRRTKDQRTGEWVSKQTIQTGIDGYRLIGHRASRQAGTTVSVGAPEWAADDGTWRPLWSSKWGHPLAARVTIRRGGEPFTAVALFDEYKQTKRDGGLTSMWAQRPAGQIAKCAEALAWRMAFPQDLAGVYVEDELQHTDVDPARPRRESAAELLTQTPRGAAPSDDTTTGAPTPGVAVEVEGEDGRTSEHPSPADPVTPAQLKKIGAAMSAADIKERDLALAFVAEVIGREVSSRGELTKDEAHDVIEALEDPDRLQATLNGAFTRMTGGES